MTINAKISKYIELKGMSLAEFGRSIDLSRSGIGNITKGTSNLTTEHLIKIRKLYRDIDFNKLLDDESEDFIYSTKFSQADKNLLNESQGNYEESLVSKMLKDFANIQKIASTYNSLSQL